ncbi:MAG: hypothetical protein AAFV95_27250 [Bacteroidota bacterium]
MEAHKALSDQEFERQFRDGEFPPAQFSHEAHLRLAWIHIRKYGLGQARENVEQQLQRFVAAAGASDKYHATLTRAAVHAVGHFVKRSDETTFEKFLLDCPQLKNNFRGLINSHYSFDIFQSDKAKAEYVQPDVSPFI